MLLNGSLNEVVSVKICAGIEEHVPVVRLFFQVLCDGSSWDGAQILPGRENRVERLAQLRPRRVYPVNVKRFHYIRVFLGQFRKVSDVLGGAEGAVIDLPYSAVVAPPEGVRVAAE